jgi:preprotein translocase subunit SecA
MQVLDNAWKEHLAAMDYLRQGIHFRGYAQKDPKQEYKRESFEMFTSLLDDLKYEVIRILSKLKITPQAEFESQENQQVPQEIHFEHPDVSPFILTQPTEELDEEIDEVDNDVANLEHFSINNEHQIGRNNPCPCGSGLKYKQCHGKLT